MAAADLDLLVIVANAQFPTHFNLRQSSTSNLIDQLPLNELVLHGMPRSGEFIILIVYILDSDLECRHAMYQKCVGHHEEINLLSSRCSERTFG